jgi:Flp pilus assembly protein TadB
MTSAMYSILIALAALIVMSLMNFWLYRRGSRAESIAEGERRNALAQIARETEEHRRSVSREFGNLWQEISLLNAKIAAFTGVANGHNYRREEEP